nr:hypothetical protein [Tanacetum cinerariifolium]
DVEEIGFGGGGSDVEEIGFGGGGATHQVVLTLVCFYARSDKVSKVEFNPLIF